MVQKINGVSACNAEQYTPSVQIKTSNTEESLFLDSELQKAKDKQGFIGKSWDSVKSGLGFGTSSVDCEKILEKYKNGEASLNEALSKIEEYKTKQDESTELISNIATGVASIAFTTLVLGTGPVGWIAAIAKGAPLGAAVKAGIKLLDRSTNHIDGDALDGKQIAKDALTGAVTGATSAVSSGVAEGIKKGNIALSIKNGAISGAECGAVGGASSYLIDVATDKNKNFKMIDLAKNTTTSAFISGTVGGAVGAGLYGTSAISGNIGNSTKPTTSLSSNIAKDSSASTTRKLLGQAERDILAA